MVKKLNQWLQDFEIQEELGLRVQELRLKSNLTQRGLAKEIAVSERTIRNFEQGKGVKLDIFIRLVRFFSELDSLDLLFKPDLLSPKEQFDNKSVKKRKRARP